MGNAENLFIDCPCEDVGEGVIKVNVLLKHTNEHSVGAIRAKSLGNRRKFINREIPAKDLYQLPLTQVRRTGTLPRSVSLLFPGNNLQNLAQTTTNKFDTSPKRQLITGKKEFPTNEYVILPANRKEPGSQKSIDQYRQIVASRRQQRMAKTSQKFVGKLLAPEPTLEVEPYSQKAKKMLACSPVKAMQMAVGKSAKEALEMYFDENIDK